MKQVFFFLFSLDEEQSNKENQTKQAKTRRGGKIIISPNTGSLQEECNRTAILSRLVTKYHHSHALPFL